MTLSTLRLSCLLLLTAAWLSGCQSAVQRSTEETESVGPNTEIEDVKSEQTAEKIEEKKAETSVSSENTAEAQTSAADTFSKQPETYCYQMRTDFINEDAIITIDSQNDVVGRIIGTSYNSDDVRYSELEGYLAEEIVYVDETSDGQTYQTEWLFDPEEIDFNAERSLQSADCSAVSATFQEAEGSAARALIDDASSVRMNRVAFEPGKSGATVSDSAIRGERIINVLNAGAGQRMSLSIESIEDNAVFDVVDPSGVVLGTELKEKSIVLPHTGNYQVIVGSTRGNASYDLEVAIR